MNAVDQLARRLKLKYLFQCCHLNYSKNVKTFLPKSNLSLTDEVIEIHECMSNFTSEVEKLTVLHERENCLLLEASAKTEISFSRKPTRGQPQQ